MADDNRSLIECEDAIDSQWDVISASDFSEQDSEPNIELAHALAESEVNFEHFDCPSSPVSSAWPPSSSPLLSPRTQKLEEFPVTERLLLEEPRIANTVLEPTAVAISFYPEELFDVDKCKATVVEKFNHGESLTADTVLETTIPETAIDANRDHVAGPILNMTITESSFDTAEFPVPELVLEAAKATSAGEPDECIAIDPVSQAIKPHIAVELVKKVVAEQQGLFHNEIDWNTCVGTTELAVVKQEGKCRTLGQVDTLLEQERELWWRDEICLLRAQVRQANSFWSKAFAASLVGLVVLGRKWHHERHQNKQLRLQLSAKDEKVNELLTQVSRLKRSFVSHRRLQVHRGKTCYHGFANCF